MSETYGIKRNIIASYIDYINSKCNESGSDWTSVNVEKTWERVYQIELPIICIRIGDTSHNKLQIGDNSTWRTIPIFIDIFAENQDQLEDLTDFIVSNIKKSIDYYEYVINNGSVLTKTANGKITQIGNISDSFLKFDTAKSELDIHDRYRSLITFEAKLNTVEA